MLSAGILTYRFKNDVIEFLLLKPGGPFYKNLDDEVWTIPKGEIQKGESEKQAAHREFNEETGFQINGDIHELTRLKFRKGKTVIVFSYQGDFRTKELTSNHFQIEYPKNSGVYREFPEIERGEWMNYKKAMIKIHPKLQLALKTLTLKLK